MKLWSLGDKLISVGRRGLILVSSFRVLCSFPFRGAKELCQRRTSSRLQNPGDLLEFCIGSNDEDPDRCTGDMAPNHRSCSVGAAVLFHRFRRCPVRRHLPRECWEMEMYGHVDKSDVGKVIPLDCVKSSHLRGVEVVPYVAVHSFNSRQAPASRFRPAPYSCLSTFTYRPLYLA
jgi:hypothetical protein